MRMAVGHATFSCGIRARWCLLCRGHLDHVLSFFVLRHHSCPATHVLTPSQFLRITCLLVWGISFFLAIATFKQIAGFNYTKPIALWIVYILWPLICTVIYIISQLILVFRTLEDRWPIGDIVFGTAFWTIAQVLLFAFSVTICDAIKHYIDGLFFFTLCMLLSVMMVYKYWDSITVGIFFTFILSNMLTLFAARRPRVLRRLQGRRVGSQGPAAQLRPHGPLRGRLQEHIRWWRRRRKPCRRCQCCADVRRRTEVPPKRELLMDYVTRFMLCKRRLASSHLSSWECKVIQTTYVRYLK